MPDRRTHRSSAPEDGQAFSPAAVPGLVRATAELAWLLSRGYAGRSALKLVGDRHELTARQRAAVGRCACSESARKARAERRAPAGEVAGAELWIDAFNALTTVEVALGGGVLLRARDRCLRDLASLHGTWRSVQETLPALELLGEVLEGLGVRESIWLLDRPVSNSGRLALEIERVAAERGWRCRAEPIRGVDERLAECRGLVATADSAVLDRCGRWFNLASEAIEARLAAARVVDLSGESAPTG